MATQNHAIDAACIDPPGRDMPGANKNAEYVSILLGQGSILGHTVWNLIDPKTSKQHFESYYKFQQNAPSGVRRVFIRSGTGKNVVRGSDWHVFVDGEHGRGHWRLNNDTGDTVQLRNSAGEMVSQKSFPAFSCTALHSDSSGGTRPPVVPAALAVAYGEDW